MAADINVFAAKTPTMPVSLANAVGTSLAG
jgi:hypothetical protein